MIFQVAMQLVKQKMDNENWFHHFSLQKHSGRPGLKKKKKAG
jgi:hypothetical protein